MVVVPVLLCSTGRGLEDDVPWTVAPALGLDWLTEISLECLLHNSLSCRQWKALVTPQLNEFKWHMAALSWIKMIGSQLLVSHSPLWVNTDGLRLNTVCRPCTLHTEPVRHEKVCGTALLPFSSNLLQTFSDQLLAPSTCFIISLPDVPPVSSVNRWDGSSALIGFVETWWGERTAARAIKAAQPRRREAELQGAARCASTDTDTDRGIRTKTRTEQPWAR